MDKSNHGFTLLEILIGLAIIGVVAVAVIPGMNSQLNKQTLKTKVSRLDTYVDQARNLAAVTECPVQMNLNPAAGLVNINVHVQLDPFLRGCTAWYSQTRNNSHRGFSASLSDVTMATPVNLHFNAVSGVLSTHDQPELTLIYRNKHADISYLGIGNGVVNYR